MNNKQGNADVKYFCCEDKIVVRIIEEQDDYFDTLEYYEPKVGGWIPSSRWYEDMFINKVVDFREISRSEAIKYIKASVEYYKRIVANPVYLRRIYGLDLEFLNDKTGEWQEVSNHDWYEKIDEYQKVTKDEVKEFEDNLFVKKKTR